MTTFRSRPDGSRKAPILGQLEATARNSGTAAKLDGLQSSLGSKIDAMALLKSETEKAAELRMQRVRWIAGTAIAAVTAPLAVLKGLDFL